jgi:pimeloyl-ACP methyl ester carboxylesterase
MGDPGRHPGAAEMASSFHTRRMKATSSTRLLRWICASLIALPVICVAACGGSESEKTSSTKRVNGTFDVGGHKLCLSCEGNGSSTIVYLHGLGGRAANGIPVRDACHGGERFCIYDRANRGASDPVPGRHTGVDSVRELHSLLENAGICSPLVLVGASFGGLLAINYAGLYPDEVKGLVLLDGTLPTDAEIDQLIPEAERAHVVAEAEDNLEQVEFYGSIRESQPLAEKLRDIPVTYIATNELDLAPTWPVKRMTMLIRKLQQGFVDRFSNGRMVFVDSPHYMEPVVPDEIAREIQRVLAAGR